MRLLVVIGAGGAGRSTVAAATAVALRRGGENVLLLSGDSPLPPYDVTPLDVAGRFERDAAGGLARLGDLWTHAGIDPVSAEALVVLPGIADVLALLEIRRRLREHDTVVFDAPPAADTLRLLALPETLGWYLRATDPAQRRLAKAIRPLMMLLGRPDPAPPVLAALARLSDALGTLHASLTDPAVTRLRVVVGPDSRGLAVARHALTGAALRELPVDAVYVNRGDTAAFGPVKTRALRRHDADPLDAAALDELAAELGPEPAAPVPARTIEPDALTLRLPWAAKGSVDVTRVGDDLVVTVAGDRRVLPLPADLAEREIAGAVFDGAALTVRFRRARPKPRAADNA